MKPKNTRFGPLFRSYGDQRNSFHLRAMWTTQKTSSNIFLKKKIKNCTMVDRSISTREALVQSISISEVKDMKSDVLRTLQASHLEKKLWTLFAGSILIPKHLRKTFWLFLIWTGYCEFNKILNFLKLFVKMHLAISFVGV